MVGEALIFTNAVKLVKMIVVLIVPGPNRCPNDPAPENQALSPEYPASGVLLEPEQLWIMGKNDGKTVIKEKGRIENFFPLRVTEGLEKCAEKANFVLEENVESELDQFPAKEPWRKRVKVPWDQHIFGNSENLGHKDFVRCSLC